MRPYYSGYAAAIAALIVHPAWLAGDDLEQYFATSAQVLAAVLITLVVGARDDDSEVVRAEGLHAIAIGLAAAISGLIVQPSEKVLYGGLFVLTTGGIGAGLAAALLLIGHRRR